MTESWTRNACSNIKENRTLTILGHHGTKCNSNLPQKQLPEAFKKLAQKVEAKEHL